MRQSLCDVIQQVTRRKSALTPLLFFNLILNIIPEYKHMRRKIVVFRCFILCLLSIDYCFKAPRFNFVEWTKTQSVAACDFDGSFLFAQILSATKLNSASFFKVWPNRQFRGLFRTSLFFRFEP